MSDDLTIPPLMRVQAIIPTDAVGATVDLLPYGPNGAVPCRSIRWMGSGPATLWYQPHMRRSLFTASETGVGVPVSFESRQWLPLYFLTQGEEQCVQALALLADDGSGHASTTGTYSVVF